VSFTAFAGKGRGSLRTNRGAQILKIYGTVLLGSAVFALGFHWFLSPNLINVGGLSGVSLLLTSILGFGGVGLFTAILNVPVFFLGYRHLGREFFLRSLWGMLTSSFFLEVFSAIPAPHTETLLGALTGGAVGGLGLGLVFLQGASTGGVDIIARLLKGKFPELSLGKLIFCVDILVVALTGLVYRDLNKALYSAASMYCTSLMVDRVLYGGDRTAVAMIVSQKHREIAGRIGRELRRGVTVFSATGFHTGEHRPVLMTAMRRNQISQLKTLVREEDEGAFVILQEAHQIFGTGFRPRHDENS
jgi:uncharacterized membrane-anchored protein YitT (DUF2179 family)